MILGIRAFALLALVWLSTALFAHNSPPARVQEVNVNGFHVYLVDLQHGNQFGYVFAVPYGSSDDEPQFRGRAHYFEHMYARGSKRYPGHETLIKAMTGFGMQRNAATSLDRTFYFATGKEDHGLEAMRMHLASMEAPELEASSAAREKKTVINEVVVSAPNRPSGAIFYLPFMVLPEQSHPLRGYPIGDLDTLEPMSPDDLRELHGKIYHAGNMKMAVFANFTSGKYTHEQVIAELMKALPSTREEVPAAYTPANHPELFNKNQVLEIHSSKERIGALFVPIFAHTDLAAVNMFLKVYSSRFRGSVTDILRRELGLVEYVDAESFRVGNQHYVMIDFRMTESGYERREEIARYLLDAIRPYQTEAVSPAVIQLMQDATRIGLRQGERDVESLVQQFSTWLMDKRYQNHLNLNWDAVAADITADKILKGASAIRLGRRVGIFMGPDARHTPEHSKLYNLKYGVREWSAPKIGLALQPRPAHMVVPKLPELTRIEPTSRYVQWSQHTEAGFQEVYDFDSAWNDRTLSLRFQFGELTALEQASLQMWVSAAREELGPELSTLASQGISLSFQASHGEIMFNAKGATHKEAGALAWLFGKLTSMAVDVQVLDRLKGSAALNYAQAEDGFPGSVVAGLVQELLGQRDRSSLKMAPAMRGVSSDTIGQFWETKLKHSNKTLVVTGAFAASEIKQLKAEALKLSPSALPGATHLQLPARAVNSGLVYRESWREASQSGVGLARIYAGPAPAELRERAALGIIGKLVHEQVFLRNRPLGYVQGAGNLSGPLLSHFLLYGQAGDATKSEELTAVWDEELAKFKNRKVSAEEIEKARSGLHATLSETPSSSDAAANEILSNLGMSGLPYYSHRLADAVTSVTAEEIYAAYDKYLSEDRPQMTVVKGVGDVMSCELMLTARDHIRQLLKTK